MQQKTKHSNLAPKEIRKLFSGDRSQTAIPDKSKSKSASTYFVTEMPRIPTILISLLVFLSMSINLQHGAVTIRQRSVPTTIRFTRYGFIIFKRLVSFVSSILLRVRKRFHRPCLQFFSNLLFTVFSTPALSRYTYFVVQIPRIQQIMYTILSRIVGKYGYELEIDRSQIWLTEFWKYQRDQN